MSTKGVTYIKINRIDNEGNDNTLTLQGLTDIRIKYSDIGVKDYPVYTIAEYPDYYLYQLYTTDITSSTDNNILDYTLLATHSSDSYFGQPSIPAPGFAPSRFIEFPDIISSSIYYNGTSEYTFQNTPNHPVTFSFSITDNESPGSLFYYIWSNFKGALEITANAGSGNSTTIGFSSSFQTGEIVGISYASANSFNTTDASLLVTQPIPPTSSLNQVVLEPYVTENFEFSDCNVLYGNVDSYPFNPLYMDVDYSTNGMIAINTDQIINGDATRSTVKPYYYSLRRHIRPRYNGSKNIDKGVFEFDTVLNLLGAAQILTGSLSINNFNPGENIDLYQNNVFKGTATIIANNGNSLLIGTSSAGGYNVNFPVKIVDLTLGIPGIAYLTPNTFENSNVFPLDTFNSEIFEYRYGTTTFPEIPNAGMLVMGNILEVADQNNVNILQQGSQYFEAYNKIISDTFTPNTILSDIRQYGDGKQVLLNELQVITSDFGTPKSPQNIGDIVEYWIPTKDCASSAMAVVYDTTFTFGSLISSGQGAYEIDLNELQQYITASSGLIPSHSVVQNISSSLDRGNRWFITIYNELPNPLDKTSLSPYTLGYISSSNVNDPLYPLLGHGVYEIESASNNPTPRFQLKNSVITGSNPLGIGNGEYGVLIWKATTPSPKQGKYVIVSKPNVNELGPGAIVLPDSNDAINNYYNEITTTYGTNTKPPTDGQQKRGGSRGTALVN